MLLVMDWDETITEHDTLSLVVPTDSEIRSISPPFSHYTDAYMQDYEKFKNERPLAAELSSLMQRLADVDWVEKRSLDRMTEGMLFWKTRPEERQKRISQVAYRAGWAQTQEWIAERAHSGHVQAFILSVNWSRQFVMNALCGGDATLQSGAELDLYRATGIRDVLANELEVDPQTQECTGRFVGPGGGEPIRTGIHKRQLLEQLKERSTNGPVVYVGDSTTDLPCLLWADVGVVIGTNGSLLRTLNTAAQRVKLVSPSAWLEQAQASAPQLPRDTLIHVQDWGSLSAVLDYLDKH